MAVSLSSLSNGSPITMDQKIYALEEGVRLGLSILTPNTVAMYSRGPLDTPSLSTAYPCSRIEKAGEGGWVLPSKD